MVIPMHLQTNYPAPPLSLNRRLHPHAEARIRRELREAVVVFLRSRKIRPRASFVQVQLIWRPATRRERDPDNVVPTVKPIADALQPGRPAKVTRTRSGRTKVTTPIPGAGLIPTDTAAFVSRPEAHIMEFDGKSKAGWWIRLTITRTDDN